MEIKIYLQQSCCHHKLKPLIIKCILAPYKYFSILEYLMLSITGEVVLVEEKKAKLAVCEWEGESDRHRDQVI